MSQPDMRPEGASRPEDTSRKERASRKGAASRKENVRRGGRGDLLSRAFPHGDWGEPAQRLDELYTFVEQGALEVIEWYLADRRWKRRAARTLRGGTAVGVATGAAMPLLELTGAFEAPLSAWGFVALLGGAVCVACDRWFGLTSGWMRDVATAQAIGRRLEELQYDWASESVREILGPTEGTASEAAERCLGVLRRFTEDVTDLVRAETADWMVEFRATTTPLRTQTDGAAGTAGRGDSSTAGPRFPGPPNGVRPNMPRQRPPEGPGR